MKPFICKIEVGDSTYTHFTEYETLVDLTATFTSFPREVLASLGFSPSFRRLFEIDGGNPIETELCQIPIRIGDETLFTLCIFEDESKAPVIGELTLREFGLIADDQRELLTSAVISNKGTQTTTGISQDLIEIGLAAQEAASILSSVPSQVKDSALAKIAGALESNVNSILEANYEDLETAKEAGLPDVLLERMTLSQERVKDMANGIRAIMALPDPVGEEFDVRTLTNGLIIGRRRVPLGVVGAIYESRPNVTVDIAALCIKSGNACILRGGSEAQCSNRVLSTLIQQATVESGIPLKTVQFIPGQDRSLIREMLRMDQYIDLLVPRGGSDLINFVKQNASMPSVTGGIGVCHTFVDQGANLDKALEIIHNAKVQRPTVCNALDTLLVHADVAGEFLPQLVDRLRIDKVELRCDSKAIHALGPGKNPLVTTATSDDWGKEFLALILAVKVVDSFDDALIHIKRYGNGHSEAIITENYHSAHRFLDEVDASAVFVNTSTRFNDGAQFGLGAEVAISTERLHARGPMGLRELTSYKWVVRGTGQVRE